MERFIISILVANHSGVLSRVSGMFTRRGFNIDTLTVGETESRNSPGLPFRCTTMKQSVIRLSSSWKKCMMSRKYRLCSGMKPLQENCCSSRLKTTLRNGRTSCRLSMSSCKITDYSPEALVIEIRGVSTKINAFIELLEPYGILKCAGQVWLLLKEAAIA